MLPTIVTRRRGAKHIARDQPCQDAVASLVTADGAVLAVADGAGSQPLSQHGARAAVLAAVEALGRVLGAEPLERALLGALFRARDAVVEAAAVRELPPQQLASTLSVAAVTPARVGVASVGDGVHVLRTTSGALELFAMAPAGELANRTTFLTSRRFAERIVLDVRDADDVEALLLSSDGLDPLLVSGPLDARFPYGGVVHGLLDMASFDASAGAQLDAFLASPAVSARTDDDCSLAIARIPRPQAGEPVMLERGGRTTAVRAVGWTGARAACRLAHSPGTYAVIVEGLDAPEVRAAIARAPRVWSTTSATPAVCWPEDLALDAQGRPFALVVRALPGRTLAAIPAAGWPPAIAGRLGAALAALHAAGHAHGALAPEHVVVTVTGDVQLVDVASIVLGEERSLAERRCADERFVAALAQPAPSLLERIR